MNCLPTTSDPRSVLLLSSRLKTALPSRNIKVNGEVNGRRRGLGVRGCEAPSSLGRGCMSSGAVDPSAARLSGLMW
ncbi:unnamed protein product [Protopolystoma xenopodis]|uniref:Uncharacterized protein n=1 Tax=Protopolystoma xenopodis TaxID=117903 RepID=A0A3S5B681_9PLAT|nr:unnamed protein product [Protopolystoma xenopodis]